MNIEYLASVIGGVLDSLIDQRAFAEVYERLPVAEKVLLIRGLRMKAHDLLQRDPMHHGAWLALRLSLSV